MRCSDDDRIVRILLARARSMPTVDAHEHLKAEKPIATDICRLIANDNYICTDLVSAGFDAARLGWLADTAVPLEARWRELSPALERVRHGAYAFSHLIALHALYGAGNLSTQRDAAAVSERLAADFASPGLFRRILRDRCGISLVLTQGTPVDHAEPPFAWLARPLDRADFRPGGDFEQDAARLGHGLGSCEETGGAMDAVLEDHLRRGACGFKITAAPWSEPSAREVSDALVRRADPSASSHGGALYRLYVQRIAMHAGRAGVPVAVHTGSAWTNWLDYRVWEPTGIIPLLSAFRGTRFDLYHAGIPWGTPASPLAKVFPNAWHNLCWAHILSPELAMRAAEEWLDMVPVNKVIGFGGDYANETVPLIFGHLEIARRNLCRVLARRVRGRRMSMMQAEEILRLWLHDNPRALYRAAVGDGAVAGGAWLP